MPEVRVCWESIDLARFRFRGGDWLDLDEFCFGGSCTSFKLVHGRQAGERWHATSGASPQSRKKKKRCRVWVAAGLFYGEDEEECWREIGPTIHPSPSFRSLVGHLYHFFFLLDRKARGRGRGGEERPDQTSSGGGLESAASCSFSSFPSARLAAGWGHGGVALSAAAIGGASQQDMERLSSSAQRQRLRLTARG